MKSLQFFTTVETDYHCIINELAKKFEGKFKCPDETQENTKDLQFQ